MFIMTFRLVRLIVGDRAIGRVQRRSAACGCCLTRRLFIVILIILSRRMTYQDMSWATYPRGRPLFVLWFALGWMTLRYELGVMSLLRLRLVRVVRMVWRL